MTISARRVVARFLQADALGDPRALLEKVKVFVDTFARHESTAMKASDLLKRMKDAHGNPEKMPSLDQEWRNANRDVMVLAAAVKTAPRLMKGIGETLFLAILQQFALPPNLQKKTQEAARYWSKTRFPMKRREPWMPGYGEVVTTYLDMLSDLREHVAVAQQAVDQATPHALAEETKLKAGPFTLINTGNFPPEVMNNVAAAVEKAATAMSAAGLGKVCYGEILVSQRITSNSRTLAFYLIDKDEMFVRADAKASGDVIETICHELAHRLHTKFLSSKAKDIQALYQAIAKSESGGSARPAAPGPDAAWPDVGREVKVKRTTWVVTRVNAERNTIYLKSKPAPGQVEKMATTSLDGFLTLSGEKALESDRLPGNPEGFVTQYAKKDPSENFAEMVAFYALGKLSKPLTDLLVPILS
jgi:hypothetical protein